MALGERITKRLTAMKISQTELARRVGISQPSISYLIREGANGSSHLHKIARELQTSPEYLSGETDDPSIDAADLAMTSEDREWLELLHGLAPVDRKALLQVARTMSAKDCGATVQSERQVQLKGPEH